MITAIENEPDLLSSPLDIDCLKYTLNEKQELLKRIIDYRDKELAHIDDSYFLDMVLNQEDTNKVHILLGDIKPFLKDLEEIVDKISRAYNGTIQQYETLSHNDTTRLLNDTIKWLYKEQ